MQGRHHQLARQQAVIVSFGGEGEIILPKRTLDLKTSETRLSELLCVRAFNVLCIAKIKKNKKCSMQVDPANGISGLT